MGRGIDSLLRVRWIAEDWDGLAERIRADQTLPQRAQKIARNITKNTTITIPEHNVPAFKPAKSFAAKLK